MWRQKEAKAVKRERGVAPLRTAMLEQLVCQPVLFQGAALVSPTVSG